MELKRIYRQAKEGNTNLYAILDSYSYPNQRVFEILGIDDKIVFKDIEELKLHFKEMENSLIKICQLLEPYYCLPILIEFVSDVYMNDEKKSKYFWGGSAKLSAALVWSNIDNQYGSNDKAYSKIADSIFISAYCLQLDMLIKYWEIKDVGQVELVKNGVQGNTELLFLNIDMQLQGRHEYKTLSFAIADVWKNPIAFIFKVELITAFSGDDPSKLFPNSLLGEIKNEDFWIGVWALLQLMREYFFERKKNTPESALGVALLPKSYFLKQSGIKNPAKIQRILEQKFWQKEWYNKKRKEGLAPLINIIVERPALRIMTSENYFATSFLLLQDSINKEIENFVLSDKGSYLFEKYLSKPFESKVINLFKSNGYLAGEVTDSRIWIRSDKNIEIANTKKFPGQIDVLAQKNKEWIICDCKVLYFPYSNNRLRNLVKKVGDEDDEGFYASINKKCEWLRESKNYNNEVVFGLLIVDRFIPLSLRSKRNILTFDQIKEYLALNIPHKDWKEYWINKLYF